MSTSGDSGAAGPPPLPGEEAGPPPLSGPGGPDGGTGGEHSRPGIRHESEETRTFPCSNCGGPLEFGIEEQRLVCPHCGHVEDIAESGSLPQERDLRAAVEILRAGAGERLEPGVSMGKEIVCQSCGGHTTFSGSLTATRCPYCATPIQRDDVHDAPARLPVDGILPFGVNEEQAQANLEDWINGRWFAPSEFKKYNRTGAFTSVYAAFFTYDADTVSDYRGQRGDDYTVTVGSGDHRRTETRTRWRHVAGTVENAFDDVAVLANDGFDHKRVRALEPWPTAAAKTYTPEFVAGHLCRTYDRDVEACFSDARERMDEEITHTVRRDIGGDHQRISALSTQFRSLTYKHLLLPLFLLTVIYEGRPFQVFINGVTGEVQGERPWSKLKIGLAIFAVLVLVAIAFVVYQSSG